MKRRVKLHNKYINYTVRASKRARRLRMAVYCDGSLVITKPIGTHDNLVEKFIKKKASWVLSKLEYFVDFKDDFVSSLGKRHYLKHKDEALAFVEKRVKRFNKIYNFRYNKIVIKNQKTIWGSCSKKKNLNFNYKIIFLPKKFADYIVAHELCHLQEFSHSNKFWNLVDKAIPDYADLKKNLLPAVH